MQALPEGFKKTVKDLERVFKDVPQDQERETVTICFQTLHAACRKNSPGMVATINSILDLFRFPVKDLLPAQKISWSIQLLLNYTFYWADQGHGQAAFSYLALSELMSCLNLAFFGDDPDILQVAYQNAKEDAGYAAEHDTGVPVAEEESS